MVSKYAYTHAYKYYDIMVPFRYLLLLAIISGYKRPVTSIRVYDCDHPDTTITPVNILEPEECKIPTGHYQNATVAKAEVFQVNFNRLIPATRCDVRITREVVHCGFDSITYGNQYPTLNHPVHLSPEQCRDAARLSHLTVLGRTFSFRKNIPKVEHFFSHGGLDQNGVCQNAAFTSAESGKKFEGAFERVQVTIEVEDTNGRLDSISNEVQFDEGIRSGYQTGFLFDAAAGTIVWNAEEELPCSDTVSKVYDGPAKIHRPAETNAESGSIVILESEATEQVGGFVLRERRTLCGHRAYTTQTDGIVIILRDPEEPPQVDVPFEPSAELRWIQQSVQRDFQYLTTNLDLFSQLSITQRLICQNERTNLRHQLSDIAGSDNPYALRTRFGPGHRLIHAAAIAYVVSCTPVNATVASFGNCTTELPVIVPGDNRTLFADPLLLTLSDIPTVIPCSDTVVSGFFIDGRWMCRTDKDPRPCPAPHRLSVSANRDGIRTDIAFGARLGAGLYSEEQLSAHRRYVAMTNARQPVQLKMADAAASGRTPGHTLGLPLTRDDEALLDRMLHRLLSPKLTILGFTITYLFHIFCIIGIIKLAVMMLFRMYMIFRHRGCGTWIFLSVFEITTTIALLPVMSVWHAGRSIWNNHGHGSDGNLADAEPTPARPRKGPPTYSEVARDGESSDDPERPYQRPKKELEAVFRRQTEERRHRSRPASGPPSVSPLSLDPTSPDRIV